MIYYIYLYIITSNIHPLSVFLPVYLGSMCSIIMSQMNECITSNKCRVLFLLSLQCEGKFLCFYEIQYGKVIGVRDAVLRKRDSCCGLLEIVADRTVGAMCLKIDWVTSMLRCDPDLFLSAL